MRVRELRLDDFPAVRALNERNGLRTPDYPEWSRLWADNPFASEFRDIPAGWVLADSRGLIVGSFCNVPRMYNFGGQTLRSANSMAWAVDQDHRPTGPLLLVREFFDQQNIDLLLNTTANHAAGRIFQALKAERLPLESYDRNLMWITRYQRFAGAATRRLGWRGGSLLQIPVAGALAGRDLWRRVQRPSLRTPDDAPDVQRRDAFDGQFDRFWNDLCSSTPSRLRAFRDARSLTWHFGPALQRGDAFILGCPGHDGASLDGYLVARRNDRPELRLRRFQIADLQVRAGKPGVAQRLVESALRVARTEGAAVVELTGFEPAKQGEAARIPHRIRKLSTWPFFFKSRDPQLQEQLRNPEVWDPSPFDGDATL